MDLRFLAGHTIRRNSQSISLATPEGTLSSIYDAYVYKSCPYIKVNAGFASVDTGEQESGDDKIVSVSGP
jgi:hypothetical protein